MSDKTFNVLFICTGNSARSILAEAILNQLGRGQFKAYSAGSLPAGRVNPYTLEILQRWDMDTSSLRSKSWDEFAAQGAPHMDLIITVCDNAAGEVCPIWPGHPATAHWGYADPSEGDASQEEKLEAFRQTMQLIRRRLELLVNLPTEKLERSLLQASARELSTRST